MSKKSILIVLYSVLFIIACAIVGNIIEWLGFANLVVLPVLFVFMLRLSWKELLEDGTIVKYVVFVLGGLLMMLLGSLLGLSC